MHAKLLICLWMMFPYTKLKAGREVLGAVDLCLGNAHRQLSLPNPGVHPTFFFFFQGVVFLGQKLLTVLVCLLAATLMRVRF